MSDKPLLCMSPAALCSIMPSVPHAKAGFLMPHALLLFLHGISESSQVHEINTAVSQCEVIGVHDHLVTVGFFVSVLHQTVHLTSLDFTLRSPFL